MTKLNSAFPVFEKQTLIHSSEVIANALLEKGVCYISGYENKFDDVAADFDALHLAPDSGVKVLNPSSARSEYPAIYSVLFAPEFKKVKRHVLGWMYKDEIEIFSQHTGPNEVPPSGILHFDKRYTFKSWYYLNDIDVSEGPMRVVPLDTCIEFSPIKLRKKIGTRNLFKGDKGQHHAKGEALEKLERSSEYVTGPKGTMFLHITEAWHGASPVNSNSQRKIIRGHSRAFSDIFVR